MLQHTTLSYLRQFTREIFKYCRNEFSFLEMWFKLKEIWIFEFYDFYKEI